MPYWLTAIIEGFQSFFDRWFRRKADADGGARQQQDAQNATDDKARDEAKAKHDEWAGLSADELHRRLDSLG